MSTQYADEQDILNMINIRRLNWHVNEQYKGTLHNDNKYFK